MATKKQAISSKNDLKTGDYFYAVIENAGVVGRLRKTKGGVFLFQDAKDGVVAKARFGFKYAWSTSDPFDENGEAFWDDVKDFRVITATEFKKLSKSLVIPLILGFDVKRVGDSFEFGCGAVKLTSKEITLVAKVFEMLGKDKETLLEVLKEILDNESPSTLAKLTPKEILSILKIGK